MALVHELLDCKIGGPSARARVPPQLFLSASDARAETPGRSIMPLEPIPGR